MDTGLLFATKRECRILWPYNREAMFGDDEICAHILICKQTSLAQSTHCKCYTYSNLLYMMSTANVDSRLEFCQFAKNDADLLWTLAKTHHFVVRIDVITKYPCIPMFEHSIFADKTAHTVVLLDVRLFVSKVHNSANDFE